MTTQKAKSKRRSQAERSSATQLKICAAGVEIIFSKGVEAASTAAIAKKADVSKGALQHHYPTKNKLYAGILELAFNRMRARLIERLDAAANVRQPMTTDDIINFLWNGIFNSPENQVALRLTTAAAENVKLREDLQDSFARWTQDGELIWSNGFAAKANSALNPAAVLNQVVMSMRGLLLFRSIVSDQHTENEVLRACRSFVSENCDVQTDTQITQTLLTHLTGRT